MKPTPSSPSKATESADVGGLLQAAVDSSVKAEVLARRFHETYERLAPNFGYKTREASAKPWSEVPSQNKELMIAVCKELISSPNPSLPVSVEHVEQEKEKTLEEKET